MRSVRIAMLAGCVAGLCATGAAASPPNVVLIISDDQGWEDFGFMGHPIIQTPNLDRLASQSLVFTRGYVPSSLCRPSLASILTGLYAHQHGITCNDPPDGLLAPERLRQRRQQIARIDSLPTLPRLLGAQGYLSFQAGKWWEGDYRRGGFTHGMTHGDPARGGRHGDEGLKIGRQGLDPIFQFLREAAGRPFFIWYAPMMPHEPHNPPASLLDKYRAKTDSLHLARYWAMCEWFDQTCGQLLDYLDRGGLAEKTLVVFVVDNGWIQDPERRGFAPKSKRSPYDGGLRTPILLRWPGRIAPRKDDRSLAMSIDLAPTILAACGLKPTGPMQGIDLLDSAAVARREMIFGEVFTHSAVDIRRPAANLQYRWCRDRRWKLILPHAANVPGGQPELYDLLADPHETANLAGSHPDVVGRLRGRIDTWWPAQ
ncbi:MAG: sulfatase family protein [Thermoguttaceae bacterium]